jgi:hypothetical protein
LIAKCTFLVAACILLSLPAQASHSLSSAEKLVLKQWFARHSAFRQATDADCDCLGDIQEMRAGSGGVWKPVPDYHPYVVAGDFNDDGAEDFAVVLIDRQKKEKKFALIVFNGPFSSRTRSPAFMETGMDLGGMGLFYGPPRPKPYRLLLGRFESDSGSLLIPHGRTYRWDDGDEEEKFDRISESRAELVVGSNDGLSWLTESADSSFFSGAAHQLSWAL